MIFYLKNSDFESLSYKGVTVILFYVAMTLRLLQLLLFIPFINLIGYGQQSIAYPTKNSIQKLDLKTGIRELNLTMTSGSDWPVMVSVPEQINKQNVLMILALHWGVSANRYQEFMNCLMLPAIDTSKYLVIAPLSQHQAWWENPKEKQLVKLLELIKEYWPVGQVIVAGYSDGGTGAVHFASKYSNLIDGAIAMAGYYRYVGQYGVPTYVIHGVKDELFSYSRSKSIMEKNQIKDPNLMFVTIESLGHYQGCAYVKHLEDGFKWIEQKLIID
ncbi:hypothetical protein [Ekhidna sp.]